MPTATREVAAAGRLVEGQAAARDRITANLLVLLTRRWRDVGVDRIVTDRELDEFSRDALELVQVGQRQTADTSAAYMRTLLERAGVDAPARDLELPASLRNLDDPTAPYRRPLQQLRRDLGRRVPFDQAARRAEQRLLVMADTDLTMAMREGVRQITADAPGVLGMRRVIHPELSRGGTCGLCVAAADRVYSARLLMPMHARCNCESCPVTEDYDPGLELNDDDLRLIYQDGPRGPSTETGRAAIARPRFRLEEHGEYGPVLVRAEDAFRGPEQVAADTGRPDTDPRAGGVADEQPVDLDAVDAPREDEPATAELPAPADLSDDDMDDALAAAIDAEEWDRFEALSAESDRRDEVRQRREQQSAARSERRRAQREREANIRLDRMVELIEEGVPEADAYSEAYGVSTDVFYRQRAVETLKGEGYRGTSFDELTRQAYRDYVYRQWQQAEDDCRGALRNRAGLARDVDDRALFSGPLSTARKYASEELLSWWEEHGRLTYDGFRSQYLGDVQGARQEAIETGVSLD